MHRQFSESCTTVNSGTIRTDGLRNFFSYVTNVNYFISHPPKPTKNYEKYAYFLANLQNLTLQLCIISCSCKGIVL